MSRYDVAIIGTGPDPDSPEWEDSAAMGYTHADAYARLDDCSIVACADLIRENAAAFADNYGVDEGNVFEDYLQMLEEVQPDVVSVATPVPTHAPIVLDCLKTGVPAAIHCEKPMATTWGDSRLMAQEADRRDIQLTFNHQRRVVSPWRDAKRLLDDGAIGDLQRVEVACGELLDNGTHFIDIANMYNDQRSVEWVIGQVDYREEHVKYGAHNENQGLALWAYDNGVFGLAVTGYGEDAVPATERLVGTEGVIEVDPWWKVDDPLRVNGVDTDGWQVVDYEEPEADHVDLAVEHVIECLGTGEEPELSARHALDTTEVIFATYESSRKRGRVDLPLTIDDNPLSAMVETGELTPAPADADEA